MLGLKNALEVPAYKVLFTSNTTTTTTTTTAAAAGTVG
jgi:hypothetical protein